MRPDDPRWKIASTSAAAVHAALEHQFKAVKTDPKALGEAAAQTARKFTAAVRAFHTKIEAFDKWRNLPEGAYELPEFATTFVWAVEKAGPTPVALELRMKEALAETLLVAHITEAWFAEALTAVGGTVWTWRL
jgi:hypothetical protein